MSADAMDVRDIGTGITLYPPLGTSAPHNAERSRWFGRQWASSTTSEVIGIDRAFREAVSSVWQVAIAVRTADMLLEPFHFHARPHATRSIDINVEYGGRGRPRLFIDDEVDE